MIGCCKPVLACPPQQDLSFWAKACRHESKVLNGCKPVGTTAHTVTPQHSCGSAQMARSIESSTIVAWFNWSLKQGAQYPFPNLLPAFRKSGLALRKSLPMSFPYNTSAGRRGLTTANTCARLLCELDTRPPAETEGVMFVGNPEAIELMCNHARTNGSTNCGLCIPNTRTSITSYHGMDKLAQL